MTRFMTLAISFLLSAGVAVPAFAETSAKDAFQLVHTADLQKSLSDKAHQVYLFDANNESTRKENGTIPGSKLLADSSHYDLSVLPTDKKANLVFYCANTECTASHTAAKRAITAGYQNVAVFADGIQGWKKAGLKTQPL